MVLPLLSREEVEARIADGDLLVIRHGYVLKLNSWIAKHPGGDKAIHHMVGRDATDEIDVYHEEATMRKMDAFRVGYVGTPWKSFVPPLQGGKFRTRAEIEATKDSEYVQPAPRWAKDFNKDVSDSKAAVIDKMLQKELESDLEKYPSLDPETQQHIHNKFRELFVELDEDGWFQCNYWGYVREFSRIGTFFALSYLFFTWRQSSLLLLAISATFLGLGWHQIVFICHDAGHQAITHNYYFDNLMGIFLASYIGGLSLTWWKRNHNVHHIVTNDPVHDPDIQHLPFFAVSERLFGSIYSTYYERWLWFDKFSQAAIQLQHYLYYPILCFGRFNLYRLSWEHLLRGLGPRHGKAAFFRWVELLGLAVFQYWFFYRLCYLTLSTAAERWTFIMVSHIATMPVHVQITLSHFAQSTSNMGMDESFPQRQIRTTLDVSCPAWFDWVHGGLQFQAVHHLFPRMPRHNFRAVQPRIIRFCEELGLHYTIFGFYKGEEHVINHLRQIGEQAKIFQACNEFCRQELIGGEAPLLDEAVAMVKEEKAKASKQVPPIFAAQRKTL
ncbi:Delta 8-(E)-sphingolipid desaturase [Wickerhamiella sorbophila]|uniref:Delta 8-(E)-sphingolipid desaturase n=1 Tax=Wickerhamiella sorbophila TaxID=45607 RepID=A0A2T0FDD2_9ASCO|nr:Delta 8-(E)-sphingolipid desaturase [Wickerhamiella sorbophila]PRT52949.1 Delta 8-(E)-sphingolipid desaturase [Wickerhamiella sorbophila]